MRTGTPAWWPQPGFRQAGQQRKDVVMTFVTGLIGIAMLLVFLGIMLWWVPAPPLIIIVVFVVALLLYDFVQSLMGDRNT
jgi:hypothetical protein